MKLKKYPVAVGGIGGSGTRVVASLLREFGFYIGSDVNDAEDNLWFTLLFKRSQVLLETDASFLHLSNLFWKRMEGDPNLDERDLALLRSLASEDRPNHNSRWLSDRVVSWRDEPARECMPWAWKEPNTHLVIDRMLRLYPDLTYIHVLRNPLDMALSENQNQQFLWGPILLGRDLLNGPNDSLSYCCAAIRRLQAIALEFPNRVHFVKFEELRSFPGQILPDIGSFAGAEVGPEILKWFTNFVGKRAPGIDRYKGYDIEKFSKEDLEFVASLGYNYP